MRLLETISRDELEAVSDEWLLRLDRDIQRDEKYRG
jgi:hypothetical protein